MKRFKVLATLSLIALAVAFAPNVGRADGPMPTVTILSSSSGSELATLAWGPGSFTPPKPTKAQIDALYAPVNDSFQNSFENSESPESWDAEYYYSAYEEVPFNGNKINTWYYNHRARWQTLACFATCAKAKVNGATKTTWYGLNPYYADRMRLTETWTFAGTFVSVGFKNGAVNFTASGDTVTYDSGNISQVFTLNLSFAGVRGKGVPSLFNVEDTATGEYYFGYPYNQSFFVQAGNCAGPLFC